MTIYNYVADCVYGHMLSEHCSYYDQLRDADGRLSDDDEFCLRENGPDGQEVDYEVECLFNNPDWLTPDYALKAAA